MIAHFKRLTLLSLLMVTATIFGAAQLDQAAQQKLDVINNKIEKITAAIQRVKKNFPSDDSWAFIKASNENLKVLEAQKAQLLRDVQH
jgi:hypothetical protein